MGNLTVASVVRQESVWTGDKCVLRVTVNLARLTDAQIERVCAAVSELTACALREWRDGTGVDHGQDA